MRQRDEQDEHLDREVERKLERDFERIPALHRRRQRIAIITEQTTAELSDRYSAIFERAACAPIAFDDQVGDCHDPDCDACRATRDYEVAWLPSMCINLGRRVCGKSEQHFGDECIAKRLASSWRPSDLAIGGAK